MSTNAESGLRNQRIEFARESTFGAAPADPSFLKYSDTISSFSATPEAVLEERRGLGSPDPADFERGPESHEVTVSYDLVKWFSATGDAAYDGLVRDADNRLPASHSLVAREDKGAVPAEHTVSGNASYATRIYVVGTGGLVDEVAITGDPSDSQPVQIELTYTYQYLRPYQIDQPDAATDVVVSSTDAGDTGVSVTIEDEGAATSETVTTDGTDGTTLVQTTATFGDIDAIDVAGDHVGDIEVAINSGSDTTPSAGDTLAVIAGSANYGGVESDGGVPALGTGSHEALGSPSPETFIGDRILRGTNPFIHEINSATLTVSNNVESMEVSDGFGMSLHAGNRNVTMEATMFGENTTYDMVSDHLQNVANDIDWEMTGGTLTVDQSRLTSPGDVAKEEGQAVMTTDNEFTGEGITIV